VALGCRSLNSRGIKTAAARSLLYISSGWRAAPRPLLPAPGPEPASLLLPLGPWSEPGAVGGRKMKGYVKICFI